MPTSLDLPAVPPPAPAGHPRRDRALVAACALVLLLAVGFDPLFGVQAHFENRTLAAWPAWQEWPPQRDWFARVDAAFADRFAGRNALIAFQHAVVVLGLHSSPVQNVLLGRDDWLYFLGEDGRSLDRFVRGTLPIGAAEIDALARELERRRRFLAARGIAYVVTIAPDKSTLYPEHLPAWVRPVAGPTPLDRATEALKRNPALRFVDLRAPLRAAKASEQVYYRTDSHWNYLGATVAYGALMREVRNALGAERLPQIAPVERPPFVRGVDRYRGDLSRMLGVPFRYVEDDLAPLAKVLGDPSRRCARRIDEGRDLGFEFYACARAPPLRAVVLRDSMAIPLIPMLSENFRRVVYVSSRRLDPGLVDRERPDIVIDEFVERSLTASAAFPTPEVPAP